MLSLPGIRKPAAADGLRTLVVGAGEAGRTLARALRRSPNYGLAPIGFLDDAPALTRVVGLPVYRPIWALPTWRTRTRHRPALSRSRHCPRSS